LNFPIVKSFGGLGRWIPIYNSCSVYTHVHPPHTRARAHIHTHQPTHIHTYDVYTRAYVRVVWSPDYIAARSPCGPSPQRLREGLMNGRYSEWWWWWWWRLNPMAKRCARSGRLYIADYIPRVLQYMRIYTVLCSTTGTVYIYTAVIDVIVYRLLPRGNRTNRCALVLRLCIVL